MTDAVRFVHIDFETRSTVDLRKTGMYVYAEAPTTDVWCACYALDEGEVKAWTPGMPPPADLFEAIQAGATLVAHNAGFERAIFAGVMGPRYGWPVPPLGQWTCTAAMAAVMALPRSLDQVGAALGLPIQKDGAGHRLMLQMCKPRRTRDADKVVWWDDAEKLARLIAYCKTDVEVERLVHTKLRELTPSEREIWILDQTINDRGVLVDLEAVAAAKVVVSETLARLNAELGRITRYAVTSASQVGRMLEWFGQRGIVIEKLDKQTVGELLAASDEGDRDAAELDLLGLLVKNDPDARRVLEIRREAAKSSTAKLEAFAARTCRDGRMRENLLYHGASTGRWAGKGAQLQNLPRPKIKGGQQALAFELFDEASPSLTDLLDILIGPPMSVVSDCLRGMIVAAPGKDLIACDFSNIEGRVIAWLAGQNDLVEMFRSGGKIYETMAAAIYDKPVSAITKDSVERQLGKTAVLGCGYGMGWAKFIATCLKAEPPIPVDENLARLVISRYREKNDRIVAYWGACEAAAIRAVKNPGQAVACGHVVFGFDGKYLRCMLPSGRKLWYAAPRLEYDEKFDKEGLTYLGVNSLTKKWGRQRTYGGRLAENITQAVARDLLAEAMLRLEAAGYPTVLTVHDEIVAEVPLGFGSVKEMEALMSELPEWARSPVVLPVAAEGWRGPRYRK